MAVPLRRARRPMNMCAIGQEGKRSRMEAGRATFNSAAKGVGESTRF